MIIPILPNSPVVDQEDKHVQQAKALADAIKNRKRSPQKNLTPVPIHSATRNSKIALILAPMWGPQVAPYGIARLAGISREAGFETQCWDINIQCYSATQGKLWNYLWDWKWVNPTLYESEIHPIILPTLEKCLAEIIEFNPTIVGFTMYYTNNKCTTWLIDKIRQHIPGVKILAGGPQSTQAKIENTDIIDHFVQGEGELIFSQLIENIENNDTPMPKVLVHDKNVRLDLDSLPIPDYRDFNIDLYQFKGVTSELSRGCIAKCQFCSETTFWKYRGRVAQSALDETEYNYKTFGIQTVWFIDSLVNGNLKELHAFAQGLIDRNITVNWAGFARNDGRMTKEYLKTLLDSGCSHLMIGVESGSQKVLDLIQKKVEIEEIEQNFKDLADLGSFTTGTSWFVGFPGEDPVDFAQTLTLVWRLRNSGINNKGFGICNKNPDTPLSLERDRFNIYESNWAGEWRTKDWSNTIAHRVIRYKSVFVLQDHYRIHRTRPELLGKTGEQKEFKSHYSLSYNIDNWIDDIPYEQNFDFYIIKPNINPLADTLVNEIWPLLRVLWQAMGTYKLDIVFDPDLDYPIYGDNRYLKLGKLWANYKFEIDNNGNWIADFYTKLESIYENNIDYNFEHKWSGTGKWDRPIVDNK